jgi:hypothetical protein
MSRRVIQRTCKKLGAKKRVLQEQIDEVIPRELKDYMLMRLGFGETLVPIQMTR